MTALPVPSSESYAGDINDSGVVVGTMRAAGGCLQLPRLHLRRRRRDEPEQPDSRPAPASTLSTPTASTTPARSWVWPTTRGAHYHAFLLTPVAPGTPVVNIGDASVTEGHTGTRTASFTVTLSAGLQPAGHGCPTAPPTAAPPREATTSPPRGP